MGKFKVLSVAEDDYLSDRFTIQQEWSHPNSQALKISITAKKNLVIETWCPTIPGGHRTKIMAFDIDIDGLLQFVQDAKTFIDEEAMIAKLIGK